MASSAGLNSPVVTAAMTAAATATGMEVVFIGGVTETDFTFRRVLGRWDGLSEGMSRDRADSFCGRLLEGGPTATTDAAAEPAYVSISAVADRRVRSYVGVPIRDASGRVLGTLCGIDSSPVPVGEAAVQILRDLASVVAAHLSTGPSAGVVIRRTPAGWQVEHGQPADDVETAEPEPDLITALTLADLLAEGGVPPRPRRSDHDLEIIDQLRVSVAQLEHALAARVAVEQAIGVLAERQRLAPRAAFERLRKSARARGRRVHLLAREVVDSAHSTAVPIPPELAGHRPG